MLKKGLILSIFLHSLLILLFIEQRQLFPDLPNALSSEKISARLVVTEKPSPLNADNVVSERANRKGTKVIESVPSSFESMQGPHSVLSEKGIVRQETPAQTSVLESVPVVVPEPAAKAPSIDVMRQYGINLARVAGKYKKFPLQARQRGWEGEVGLVVGTSLGSVLPVVSIGKSSGFDELDRAALEMLSRAVREAVMPNELSGKQFALTLPIRFSLED